ncbi:hypothetical protein BSLA_01f1916 [Burkholderia stabilis]|nr:hypothetical protein BSLA_01f1916 [Burkholderia stabilis]
MRSHENGRNSPRGLAPIIPASPHPARDARHGFHLRAAGGFTAGPDHGIIRACMPAERLRPGCPVPCTRRPPARRARSVRRPWRAPSRRPRTVVPEIQVGVVSCRREPTRPGRAGAQLARAAHRACARSSVNRITAPVRFAMNQHRLPASFGLTGEGA